MDVTIDVLVYRRHETIEWGFSYGFNLDGDDRKRFGWGPLGDLWIEQIIQRREAEVADLLPVEELEEILR